jgi:hypothetical protein
VYLISGGGNQRRLRIARDLQGPWYYSEIKRTTPTVDDVNLLVRAQANECGVAFLAVRRK